MNLFPIILLGLFEFVVGQFDSNSTFSNTTADATGTIVVPTSNDDLGKLFSNITPTDVGLLVGACIIIGAILIFTVRQGIKSRNRIQEIRTAEIHYAIHHFDKQALAIPHPPPPPDPLSDVKVEIR